MRQVNCYSISNGHLSSYFFGFSYKQLLHLFLILKWFFPSCLIQVLSDFTKKKNYDEQLIREESGRESQQTRVTSQQVRAHVYLQ